MRAWRSYQPIRFRPTRWLLVALVLVGLAASALLLRGTVDAAVNAGNFAMLFFGALLTGEAVVFALSIDPKVKAWIDNMPAACKTFFPFGKLNDPKADQTMPKSPEVEPSWAPTASAPMMPAFGNKWPTTSMPTGPAGTGGSSTRTQWQGGTFPSSPGWGH